MDHSDWIGSAFAGDTGWTHLERLVDIGNRMAGSEGEQQGAEVTREAFEELGARNVRIDEFEIPGWERGSSTVRAGDAELDCIALPRSPSGAVEGELVDVGHGLPEDFERDLEGAVVLARSDVPDWYERYIHRTEKYYRAVEAGAAAFVYANHVPGCLPPTGSVGTEEEPIGEIPAIGVSKEVGARLARRERGRDVSVSVTAEIGPATSYNVHADIGPDTEEAVLLTSHVDAHDIAEGAGDNAAGTALVVHAAEALLAREPELETRVHCIVFGSEEVGLRGSEHDAATRDPGSVKAIVNNDGVVRARTLQLRSQGFPELRAAGERVAERMDHPIDISPRISAHSDQWPYVQRGIPGYQVSNVTGEQGRGWGHTQADTFDKLEHRNLREQAILVTELVVELARAEIEIDHRDPTEIRDQLEAEGVAESMKVIDEWPFDEDA